LELKVGGGADSAAIQIAKDIGTIIIATKRSWKNLQIIDLL
jgi:hypothetical protein